MEDALGEWLRSLRKSVDALDEAILRLSRARIDLCREIGRVKGLMGLEVFDPAREKEVLSRASSEAERRILEVLIHECKRIQWEDRLG